MSHIVTRNPSPNAACSGVGQSSQGHCLALCMQCALPENISEDITLYTADIFQIDPDQVRAAGASRRKEPHLASPTVVEIVDSSS